MSIKMYIIKAQSADMSMDCCAIVRNLIARIHVNVTNPRMKVPVNSRISNQPHTTTTCRLPKPEATTSADAGGGEY